MEASSICILVVEDDHLIHDLLEAALVGGGFSVIKAKSAEDAISMLDAKNATFSAVVTDINLSGILLGWDVARHARELHSEIPIVYMSGAGGEDWTANGVPNSVLVPKQFAPAQIVTAVSQLLNKGNTPA